MTINDHQYFFELLANARREAIPKVEIFRRR